jgi:hypothetical protein
LPKEVHRGPIMQRFERRDEQLLAAYVGSPGFTTHQERAILPSAYRVP